MDRRDRSTSFAWPFNGTLFFVIVLSVLLLAFAGGVRFMASGKPRSEANLGSYLVRQSEPLTELYFADYGALPKKLETGRKYTGSFVIENHTGALQTYRTLLTRSETGVPPTTSVVIISIENGGSASTPFELYTDQPGRNIAISIMLDGPGHTISYKAAS